MIFFKSINYLLATSLSTTSVQTSRKAAHKKFADRRTQSHDSDPNILESTSSSEDLKTMAEVLEIRLKLNESLFKIFFLGT